MGNGNMHEAFRDLHHRGFSVIPVRPGSKAPPLIDWRSYQRKRVDAPTLERWLASWPTANPAVVTGRVSGVIVLDTDGPEAVRALATLGGTPPTWTVQTRNGYHYYFRYPFHAERRIRNFVKKLPGLDLRADGGYVMAPGEVHPSGGAYEWVEGRGPDDVELASPPEWLRSLLAIEEGSKIAEANAGNSATHEIQRSTGTRIQSHAYAEAALRGEVEKVAASSKGSRNDQLNRSSYALGRLVASGILDRGYVERELESAARSAGLDRDPACGIGGIRATIQSGIQAGLRTPRRIELQEQLSEMASKSRRAATLVEPTQRKEVLAFPYPETQGTHEQIGNEQLHEVDSENTGDGGEDLPIIDTSNRQLHDLTSDALKALMAANEPPQTFVRSFDLVRALTDEQGRPKIEILRDSHICGRLARVANFVRYTRGGEIRHVPPIQVVRDFTALGIWPLPTLEGIVEAPTLRPDGSILDVPGYDPPTRLLYIPARNLNIPAIPASPTRENVSRSLELIDDVFGEFPYVDPSSRANLFGLLLTPVVRQSFKGHVPLALLDAPRAGTGKGLLTDAVCLTTTGRSAALMSAPSSDEEWRKRLTGVLLDGPTMITIDNVESKLSAPSLAAVLTAHNWHDRVLGSTSMVTLPQRATWIATGNNIRLGGDLPRRCYWIRLDSQLARPWQRPTERFRYPNLLGWIAEHRGELLAALLTIARAWYAAGKPTAEVPALGSFEAWARTVGGILAHAGVTGFLQNLNLLYEQNDEETAEWEGFLGAWYDAFGERTVTVADICGVLAPGNQQQFTGVADGITDTQSADLRESIPADLAEGLEHEMKRAGSNATGNGGSTNSGFRRKLGKALSRRVDVRYGDLRLERATDDPHSKVSRWRVRYMRDLRG